VKSTTWDVTKLRDVGVVGLADSATEVSVCPRAAHASMMTMPSTMMANPIGHALELEFLDCMPHTLGKRTQYHRLRRE
jgi:hypothetical protein